MFTDGEINRIIETATLAFKHNKIPDKWEQNFLLSLRSYLTKEGLIKDVCPACLGSGKNKTEKIRDCKLNKP